MLQKKEIPRRVMKCSTVVLYANAWWENDFFFFFLAAEGVDGSASRERKIIEMTQSENLHFLQPPVPRVDRGCFI